jgi:hypothetical protein
LLFELINRRHEKKSTLITTNKSFSEWPEVFPNVALAMIDRLSITPRFSPSRENPTGAKRPQEQAAARSRKRTAKAAT